MHSRFCPKPGNSHPAMTLDSVGGYYEQARDGDKGQQ